MFWHSDTLALSPGRQNVKKNKKGGLDHYGHEHVKVKPFDTTGLEMVNTSIPGSVSNVNIHRVSKKLCKIVFARTSSNFYQFW